MSHEQWNKMTADAQNTKIAEFCGWTNFTQTYQDGHIDEDGCWIADGPVEHCAYAPLIGTKDGVKVLVPNFVNDLNAMHEAEMTIITDEDHKAYIQNLCVIHGAKHVYLATASERAEAFIKTMDAS